MTDAGTRLFASKPKRDKFYKAAEKLWATFEKAVSDTAQAENVTVTIGEGVFSTAVVLSGPKIFENIDCFEEDGDEMGTDTHTCANFCGVSAVNAVKNNPDPKIIDPTVFANAWSLTRATYQSRMCDVENLRKRSEADEAKTAAAPAKMWAFGC